ncbi:uncharacterized protein LOC129587841 [Paramacrobiotus metropolitanus]|uniref:uncharacterized protein LOC129587841 n=1 Tax=Paramacrobiotus metropolitanus TaxID=2943436 RepID=UPI002445AB7A|nr:uncharacterized protein LOC129587841 [Paramacrobiotus metropolitanus]
MSEYLSPMDWEAWGRNFNESVASFNAEFDIVDEILREAGVVPEVREGFVDPDTQKEQFLPRYEAISPPPLEPDPVPVLIHVPEPSNTTLFQPPCQLVPAFDPAPPMNPSPLSLGEQASLHEFLQVRPGGLVSMFANVDTVTLAQAGALTINITRENGIPQFATLHTSRGKERAGCATTMGELRAVLRFLLSAECEALSRSPSPPVQRKELASPSFRKEFSLTLHAAWISGKHLQLRISRRGDNHRSVATPKISQTTLQRLRGKNWYELLPQLFPGFSHGIKPLPQEFWNDFRAYLTMEAVHAARSKDIVGPTEDQLFSMLTELHATSFYSILIELMPVYSDCSFTCFASTEYVRQQCQVLNFPVNYCVA